MNSEVQISDFKRCKQHYKHMILCLLLLSEDLSNQSTITKKNNKVNSPQMRMLGKFLPAPFSNPDRYMYIEIWATRVSLQVAMIHARSARCVRDKIINLASRAIMVFHTFILFIGCNVFKDF